MALVQTSPRSRGPAIPIDTLLRSLLRLAMVAGLIASVSSVSDAPASVSTYSLVSTRPVADTQQPAAADDQVPAPEESLNTEPTAPDRIERAIVLIQTEEAAGSGFIVSIDSLADGSTWATAITNAHVVGDASAVTVWFSNGALRDATVVASDPSLDVAVIEVPRPPRSVQPLQLADATHAPHIGDPAWAWGYPFEAAVVSAGFSRAPTLSTGIISARRTREGIDYLQTDAAVNPGSSGGPITNGLGQVIGINTFILTPGGTDAEGLNFALDTTSMHDHLVELLGRGSTEAVASTR